MNAMWLQAIKKEKYLYSIKEKHRSHRIRTEWISSNGRNHVGYHRKDYREIENLSFFKPS